ncbi:GNAT family N-acetyltransferase [Cryobacterium sp. CG_9.6]|uniref:GNAT family N-acetyltransferase n=1 Tax=Cryobacterium sp. CG_9.6 TaxID=2760710 RepID=UPI00247438F0|nr:GNAT family N-acetyltransferase [Cryobacterium sp. CG_9.6]MDH6236712.1 GNAT superfamily N-acetyltransferase [Cryobacterium sp. CG_9.6]
MLRNLALPVILQSRVGPVTLRRASPGDLDSLMMLLSDDPVSASRGDTAALADRPAYLSALTQITADRSNDLLIALDGERRILGTMQLTLIPGMARRGSTRLLIEAVRVRSDTRSSGIGSAMMRWVTDIAAPSLDAGLVQLTSDAVRTDAHRFYERLGFVKSHVGFKYQVLSDAE